MPESRIALSPIKTPKLKTGGSLGRLVGDMVGATVGMRVGYTEGGSEGERLGPGVGWKVGKKVVVQTPLHGELSQIHIAAPVEQLPQQEIQLHLLFRNTSDPREEIEFGKVTPREKPKQSLNELL